MLPVILLVSCDSALSGTVGKHFSSWRSHNTHCGKTCKMRPKGHARTSAYCLPQISEFHPTYLDPTCLNAAPRLSHPESSLWSLVAQSRRIFQLPGHSSHIRETCQTHQLHLLIKNTVHSVLATISLVSGLLSKLKIRAQWTRFGKCIWKFCIWTLGVNTQDYTFRNNLLQYRSAKYTVRVMSNPSTDPPIFKM